MFALESLSPVILVQTVLTPVISMYYHGTWFSTLVAPDSSTCRSRRALVVPRLPVRLAKHAGHARRQIILQFQETLRKYTKLCQAQHVRVRQMKKIVMHAQEFVLHWREMNWGSYLLQFLVR